jgi:hypothetical protein
MRYRIETVHVPETPRSTAHVTDDAADLADRRIIHVLGTEESPGGGLRLRVLTEQD